MRRIRNPMRAIHLDARRSAIPIVGLWKLMPMLLSALCLGGCGGGRENGELPRPPARSVRGTLCGSSFEEPPTIDTLGVGPITVTRTIAELRRLCPELRDTVVDGHRGLAAEAFGSVIVAGLAGVSSDVDSDSVPLDFVAIVGGSLRTERGVGPGSALDELRRAYGEGMYLGCGGNVERAMFERPALLQFVFGHACSRLERVQPRATDGDLRVHAVEIVVPA